MPGPQIDTSSHAEQASVMTDDDHALAAGHRAERRQSTNGKVMITCHARGHWTQSMPPQLKLQPAREFHCAVCTAS